MGAVVIFFVPSGFLIGGSLTESMLQSSLYTFALSHFRDANRQPVRWKIL